MAPGDSTILVTGGTGQLGAPTVRRLREAGHRVRVMSRRADGTDPDLVRGDLGTGVGVAAALEGVRTVVHLVQGGLKEDEVTKRLALAAKAAGVAHLVYISIVGIERNQALAYYAAKLRSEQAIAASGVPHTILRATQFHSFVARIVRGQTRWPVAFLPRLVFQPIAIEEVVTRLVELVGSVPQGMAADIAGPEQLTLERIAHLWYQAHGREKRVLPLPAPGAAMRNYARGTQLGTLPGYGRITFAEYAAAEAAAAQAETS